MNLIHEISFLKQKIEILEQKFAQYFMGLEKRPPLKELSEIKSQISQLIKMESNLKQQSEKFQVQTIVNRFTTYRLKWERGVRDIEEGRIKPGSGFFGGMGTSFKNSLKIEKKTEQKDSVIEKTAKQYVELSRKFLNKNYDTKAVSQMLEKKMKEIKTKMGNNIVLRVYFDGQKVKIKPVKKEDL
jgi:hypothetical protein